MRSKRVLAISLAATGVAAIGVATIAGSAAATPSSGLTTTILAQSKVPALDIRAHATRPDAWRVRLTSRGLSDGYVVDNVIAPGGTTGWHSHPGPSLIFVVRGAVTNYESDDPKCTGHVYSAGSSFVDAGGRDVHTLRNNGDVPAETIAVQLIPSGAQRRIDAAAPPNCTPRHPSRAVPTTKEDAMTWSGLKKLAFVPVFRPHAHPPDLIPADWAGDIERRVFFDPDPVTGFDRSLRAYIHTVSSGRADLDAVVFPMVTVDEQDVPANVLEGQLGGQLRGEGFDAAAIVMLGGPGAGTSSGYWVRFVMAEGVGVWAMEFMHSLTGFGDLYPFGGTMGAFDEMACSCGTHPSAYTKAAIGWLDGWAIVQHLGGPRGYRLHPVGLVQPPPSDRVTAVRVGVQVPYLLIEARRHVDLFDRGTPSEGVIVYRVQTSDPLGHAQNATAPVELLTPTALSVGGSYVADTGATVQVESLTSDGYAVTVDDPASVLVDVPDLFQVMAAMAAHILEAEGLVPKFSGPNTAHSWVAEQSPGAGTQVPKGTTVSMLLRTGPLQ